MMAKTHEYRGEVLERQRVQAVKRLENPYGSERAWQLNLRSGGIFYEPIGSYINGLYCPFRPPDDEALLRGMLLPPPKNEEQQRLEKMESKILAASASAPHLAGPPPGLLFAGAAALGGDAVPEEAEEADEDDIAALDEIDDEVIQAVLALRDKYNIEGAAPAHLNGQERTLWGIFREIDTDESGTISKIELQVARAPTPLCGGASARLIAFSACSFLCPPLRPPLCLAPVPRPCAHLCAPLCPLALPCDTGGLLEDGSHGVIERDGLLLQAGRRGRLRQDRRR